MTHENFLDATHLVRQLSAGRPQNLEALMRQWKVPIGSRIEIQDRTIYFTPEALDKLRTTIIPLTKGYNVEVPFQYAMKDSRVLDVIPIASEVKSGIETDVSKPPLDELLAQTSRDNVGYGHTHPTGYGPIFSLSGQSSRFPYGKDYSANVTHRDIMRMSGLHLVIARGNDGENLIGICEAGNNGTIKMYPWQVLKVRVVEPRVRVVEPKVKVVK